MTDKLRYPSGMFRLRELREKVGLTQLDLARKVGVTQSTIVRWETGQRSLSKAWAVKLGQALGTDPASLMFSSSLASESMLPALISAAVPAPLEGYRPPPAFMNTRDTMPVYASAEGGNGHLIISTDEIDRVSRPFTLESIPEAYAILITGESMFPAYKPGDYAWVNPRLPPQRDTECIFYAIDDDLGEAQATIKNLVGWDREAWHVEQYNPATQFSLERAVWVKRHRVVGNFRRR